MTKYILNFEDRLKYYTLDISKKWKIYLDDKTKKCIYNDRKVYNPPFTSGGFEIIDTNINNEKIMEKFINTNSYHKNNYIVPFLKFLNSTNCFKNKKILCAFGDIYYSTDIPVLCKTRPLIINEYACKLNKCNIIFNMDKERHFESINIIKEQQLDIPFYEKNNKIVWRGENNGEMIQLIQNRPCRHDLVKLYANSKNKMFDIGFVNDYSIVKKKILLRQVGRSAEADNLSGEDIKGKGRLSIKEQLKSKFIISLEGGDVGTGLKWMLYSNSVVLMPKPTMEGWYMEGLLEPWVHYVPLENDFSDLEEKYEWCLNNLDKCEVIAYNGNKYMQQFFDEETEKKLETSIIQKYIEWVEINYNSFVLNTLSYKKDNNLRFYIEKQEDYLHTISKLFKKTINKFEMDFYAFGYPKNNFSNDLVKMDNLLSNASENDLFIFNELDFSNLREFYNQSEDFKNKLIVFFEKIHYVVFFCEILMNDKFQTKGSNVIEEDYANLIFKNATKIICCDTKNISFLSKVKSKEDIIYFPPIGYSPYKNYNFNKNIEQDIDILFYGNINASWIPYRSNFIDKIKNKSDEQNLKFKYGTFHGEEKNKLLQKSKIVIHIPSYENLRTFPWAKTGELMLKKVFFIIEENDELYNKNLNDLVVYYKKNNIDDLMKKINYYLQNPDEMSIIVEKCYHFMKNKFNLDNLFKQLYLH